MSTRLETALAELVDALREELRADLGQPTPARLLTVDETAEMLRLSRTTVYGELAAGRLRSAKVGRRRLVAETWVREYIEHLG
jgi:excisionase family DNA binding protein